MNIIKNILALLVVSTSFYLTNAREKHPFPPEFYTQQKLDVKTPPSILASHPDDIYWTDVSSKSGGLIDYVYQLKVNDGILYALGVDTSGYGIVGSYTKKDGWKNICDIYIDGYIRTFSVDGDNIYFGGYFSTAGPTEIPVQNVVRYSIKSKQWHQMGDGLWDPKIPNLGNVIEFIEAYKGDVFIRGRYTHTGNRELLNRNIRWDGDNYIEDNIFGYFSPVHHNNLIYDFGASVDTSIIVRLSVGIWDGVFLSSDTKETTWHSRIDGVMGGYGFGIDAANNYYIKSDFDISVTDSTPRKYGTCFMGYSNNEWKLLGGSNAIFNEKYYEDLLSAVDGDGQVYVFGIFREGIGIDKLYQKSSPQIVVWNGNEWTTLGSGVSRFPLIKTIQYYDGDVYIGGSGLNIAGDKATYGFAKWNKRKVSAVNEQPITSIPEVHLSPNPASDHITVELDNESNDCTIILFDLYGSNVGTYRLDGKRSTINTDHLSSGLYTLRVQYGGRIASTSMTIVK